MLKINNFSLFYENEFFRIFLKPPAINSSYNIGDPIENIKNSCVYKYKVLYEKTPDIASLINPKDTSTFERESGLIYRLDYPTSGLLLFARTKEVYEALREKGRIGKTYNCTCVDRDNSDFFTGDTEAKLWKERRESLLTSGELKINDLYFRKYNGAFVRAISYDEWRRLKNLGKDVVPTPYEIYIKLLSKDLGNYKFEVLINRGFRHHIRATMASLGFAIVWDYSYGYEEPNLGRGSTVPDKISLLCRKIEFELNGEKYFYEI